MCRDPIPAPSISPTTGRRAHNNPSHITRTTTQAATRPRAPRIGPLSDRLRQAGELLGVTLLDFVIVTDPAEGFRYYSFKEAGVL